MSEIKPYNVTLYFSNIPKRWLPLSSLGNDSLNTFHLFFPVGEKLFILKLKNIDSSNFRPLLKSDLRGFIGQESMRANMHEKLFQVLGDIGYEFYFSSKSNLEKKDFAEFSKYINPKFHDKQKIDHQLTKRVFDRLEKKIAA